MENNVSIRNQCRLCFKAPRKHLGNLRLALVMPCLVVLCFFGCKSDERPSGPRAPVLPPIPTWNAASRRAPTVGSRLAPLAAPVAMHRQDIRELPVAEQQAYLVALLRQSHSLGEAQVQKLNAIVGASDTMSFGNPKLSRAEMTQAECLRRRREIKDLSAPECRSPYMVPVGGAGAAICIDQFEFPNLPCEYPLVWVRSSEAAAICSVLGKRLCDAHEWEGACAGAILPPEEDYGFSALPPGGSVEQLRQRRLEMEYRHNAKRRVYWAYGPVKDHSRCATGARNSARCVTSEWETCGTNDYPAGAFPDCVSAAGVYDLHGNVAEHMSLPIFAEEIGGNGWTEMKGSWFIFASGEAHDDDCRWRAKNWHGTRVSDAASHRNYHLGFRCCKELPLPY